MATIKSFTSLEQSKKLAEILPLESADYYHATDAGVVITASYITYCGKERCVPAYKGAVPCWSLAALLEAVPKIHGLKPILDLEECSIQYSGIDLYVVASNLVDACYEMILKLNELNLL